MTQSSTFIGGWLTSTPPNFEQPLHRPAQRQNRSVAVPVIRGLLPLQYESGRGVPVSGDSSSTMVVGLVLEGVPEREALSNYQTTRDALSTRLFEATDAIASYGWSLNDIARLQLDMSAAMRVEVEALLALDAVGTPVAA